jgi:hypothetical protein
MLSIAKCPHCEAMIDRIEVTDIPLTVALQPQWKGFAYLCPRCRKVLSVELNPLAGQDDIVRRIAEMLGH